MINKASHIEIHNLALLLSLFSFQGNTQNFSFALFGAQDLIPQEEVQDTLTFPNISDPSFPSRMNKTWSPWFFSTTDPMKHHTPSMYFPFFTTLEFISYMGWIKVAETLINPFGDDDEVYG